MSKKLFAFITGLFLVMLLSFISILDNPQVNATVSSIAVLSPNGGETLQEGSAYTIKWNATNLPSDAKIYLTLFRSDGANTSIVLNLLITQREYVWKVSTAGNWGMGYDYKPSFIAKILGIKEVKAAGYSYQIMISASWGTWGTTYYGNVYDKSDASFTIVVPTISSIKAQLSAITPAAGTQISRGTNDVSIAAFDIVNSNNTAVDIQSIRLVCQGCADPKFYDLDFSVIKLIDGSNGAMIAGIPIDASKIPIIDTNISFQIPNNSKKTLLVKADFPSTSKTFPSQLNFYIELRSLSAISSIDGSSVQVDGLPIYAYSLRLIPAASSITVLSPNGGEVWEIGKTYQIKWNSLGLKPDDIIEITLGTDNQYFPISIADSKNTGIYEWTISSTIKPGKYYISIHPYGYCVPEDCKIISDSSDAAFSIVAAVSYVSEQVKCVFKGSQTEQKCYTATDSSSIYYNLGCSGKETCIVDIKGTKGDSITWKSSCGGYAYTTMDGQNEYAEFDCTTAIPSITVLSPNGGESWPVNSTQTVRWASSNIPSSNSVKIVARYHKDGVPYTSNYYDYVLKESTPNDGSETLVVGDFPLGVYLLQVKSSYSNIVYDDWSDSYFKIVVAFTPSITVLSPNGGEVWGKGKTYTIQWKSSSDVTSVYIKLRKGSDTYSGSEGMVSGTISNIGSYQWMVPTTLPDGNDYAIRIIEASGRVLDDSDAPFSIVAAVECLPDDTLVKIPNDPNIYIIKNCRKVLVTSWDTFIGSGYKTSDIKTVPASDIAAIASVSLFKSPEDGKVYLIKGTKRLWIPSANAFENAGYKWSDIVSVAKAQKEAYPEANLIKATDSDKVYVIGKGLIRYIPNPSVFDSYEYKWNEIVTVTPTELNLYGQANLTKGTEDNKVYLLENNQKRWITTAQKFNTLGYDWNKILEVNSTELNTYSTGKEI